MDKNTFLNQIFQTSFQHFPEGVLKNYLFYLYYGKIQKNGFKLKYNLNYLTIFLDNSVSIKFCSYNGIPEIKMLLEGYTLKTTH